MKAIILAAGEAKRLRPITNELPKCLISICEKAIIDYQIDNLLKSGITDIIFVVGFQKEKIIAHVKENYPEIQFTFIENPIYAETHPAYSLWLAKGQLTGDVLYLNADVICDPRIVDAIAQSNLGSVTAVQKNVWDEEEVNVIVDPDTMQIKEIGKHILEETSHGEFIGVTKMDASFNAKLQITLDTFVEAKMFNKFAADALNKTIMDGGVLYALDVSDKHAIEIDTPEDLKEACKKVEHIIW